MHAHALNDVLQRMRRHARLAVVHGGDPTDAEAVVYSTRNPRSTRLYRDVAQDIADSLRRSGFEQVFLFPDDMRLPQRLADSRIDLAWLNTAGTQGLSSPCHAPAMLELCGIPYVGHHPLNAALLDNKHMFKHVVSSLGLPTAPYVTVNLAERGQDIRQRPDFIKRFAGHAGDFVVKPVSGRASLHVHCVNRTDLPCAIEAVFEATGNTVLIESYLSGAEFTVGVSGPVTLRQGSLQIESAPFVFSLLQRLLDPDERIFTSKDVRPIGMGRLRVLAEDQTPEATAVALIARKLHTRLALESTVRVDFRTDERGRVCLLEANPKPDLKAPADGVVSLLAAGLPQQRMSYDELIVSLLADRIHHLLTRRRDYAVPLLRFCAPINPSGA